MKSECSLFLWILTSAFRFPMPLHMLLLILITVSSCLLHVGCGLMVQDRPVVWVSGFIWVWRITGIIWTEILCCRRISKRLEICFGQILRTFLSLKIKEVARNEVEDKNKSKKMTRDDRFKKFSRKDRKVRKNNTAVA